MAHRGDGSRLWGRDGGRMTGCEATRNSCAAGGGQVDSLGHGSHLHGEAEAIRAAAEASWQGLQPALGAARALEAFGGRRPGRSDFQWAFSMLLSRLIRLPVSHTPPPRPCPTLVGSCPSCVDVPQDRLAPHGCECMSAREHVGLLVLKKFYCSI